MFGVTLTSLSLAISHPLPTETDFVVVSVVRKLIQINVVRPLSKQRLQILKWFT